MVTVVCDWFCALFYYMYLPDLASSSSCISPRFQILHLQSVHCIALLSLSFSLSINLFSFLLIIPLQSTPFQWIPKGPHIPSRPIRVVPCSASAPSILTWATIIGLILGPALTLSTCQPRHFFTRVLGHRHLCRRNRQRVDATSPHFLHNKENWSNVEPDRRPPSAPKFPPISVCYCRNHLVLDVLVFFLALGNQSMRLPNLLQLLHYPHRTELLTCWCN
jgi:hypothetical protein